MKVFERNLDEIQPYEKNPRKNEAAVEPVAESLKEFGWQQPIVVDADGVIIAGHTRWKAAQRLGMKTVPVVIASDLSPEQVKAYRLADNKSGGVALWDDSLLDEELFGIENIDMSLFGFDMDAFTARLTDDGGFFERESVLDDSREEDNEEYNEFLDKFENKKTTDDCYTPDLVYDAVADWVAKEYGVERTRFVRPFYPGGDYQKYKYAEDAIVVDNPPFSILAEILKWYEAQKVPYFLFGPALTLFSSAASSCCCAIPVGVSVTYENGAVVNTSFLTNLEAEDLRVRTAPDLYKVVDAANREWAAGLHKSLPKYLYPDEVITCAMMARWSKYGIDFRATVSETAPCSALDAQKKEGKAIFGKGFLLSERAAAERAAAARAAAERAAATRWPLSEREKEIVRSLG